MSLSPAADPVPADLTAGFGRLLGSPPVEMTRLPGGGNSRVYRLVGPEGRVLAGKVYLGLRADGFDRLAVEYQALAFLQDNGVEAVPRPVAFDSKAGLAVYEFCEGRRIVPAEIGPADLDQATAFLLGLKSLGRRPKADRLPPASEACFSGADIQANLTARLKRLRAVGGRDAAVELLFDFLDRNLAPAMDLILNWASARFSRQGLDWNARLDPARQTLSPSDFGFHNALRRKDGSITWLDFEYFGWDDPAKMTADFLLHPAMNLDREAGRRFTSAILDGFSEVEDLAFRLETVYPLFGLKWCLILLNEFVPADLERRDFAAGEGLDADEIRRRQLDKAASLLNRILDEYESFPYA